MPRPRYQTIIDEIGMTKSMPTAKEQFEWYVSDSPDECPVVFLGLGPEPDKIPKWFGLSDTDPLYFVECQDFVDQTDNNWNGAIPDNFTRIAADAFTTELAANSHVIRYLPVQKAFPSFYGPLTARLLLCKTTIPAPSRIVWLPTLEEDLLGRELGLAFEEAGYTVRFIDHEALGKHPGTVLPELLEDGTPDLFFSVNFKGLDHFGLCYHILREAGAQVAIWMVDNPFNLLPAVKSGYWKNAKLFVTDHSFIGPLIETGARWVTHLPLAASPHFFENGGQLPDHAKDIEKALVFVGRSAFPDKDKFFAGVSVDPTLLTTIHNAEGAHRFDYFWWREQMKDVQLWPGNQVRQIGAGAEFASSLWKNDCLHAAGKITIFGDDGWKTLENADVRPVVDYYVHLPAIYRTAPVTLNITGMQLPAGLTQRHFDVWCAGGFLISDANPGLQIFPEELVEQITYIHPDEIHDLFLRYREETQDKQELRKAWRECILRDHTYSNRVDTILTALNL
nr:DUF3880 domain-containing protein [uncultured Pseudodesulfovibrio sp.]